MAFVLCFILNLFSLIQYTYIERKSCVFSVSVIQIKLKGITRNDNDISFVPAYLFISDPKAELAKRKISLRTKEKKTHHWVGLSRLRIHFPQREKKKLTVALISTRRKENQFIFPSIQRKYLADFRQRGKKCASPFCPKIILNRRTDT